MLVLTAVEFRQMSACAESFRSGPESPDVGSTGAGPNGISPAGPARTGACQPGIRAPRHWRTVASGR